MKTVLRIGARSVVRHAREIHLAEIYYKTHAKPFGYSSRFPPCLLRSVANSLSQLHSDRYLYCLTLSVTLSNEPIQ
ncbi:hypothetical protein CUMW_086140 [Citrus unshiu]|nr:hypothetical protein CUMW_086140 [Citrus unshiu]